MQAILFNTGREYTPDGQVIVAWVVHESADEFGPIYTVRFQDTSRRVGGEIKGLGAFTQEAVMARYDLTQYNSTWIREEEIAAALAAAR